MSARGKRAAGARGRPVAGDPGLDKVLAEIRTVAVWGKLQPKEDAELLRAIQDELGDRPAAHDLAELRLEMIQVAAMAVLQVQVIDQQLGT